VRQKNALFNFLRTNSPLAASASHLVIGGAGIFLFGIEEFVQKLA